MGSCGRVALFSKQIAEFGRIEAAEMIIRIESGRTGWALTQTFIQVQLEGHRYHDPTRRDTGQLGQGRRVDGQRKMLYHLQTGDDFEFVI